jgi:hypothetical protein
MQSRNLATRKSSPNGSPGRRPDRRPDRPPRGLLSVRSALVLTLALFTAGGGAVLLAVALTPPALIILGAFGIFASALKLFDSMIE